MKDIDTLLDLPYTCLHWIDAGTFLFQDEVKITFKKGFYAGCYLVTQELYEKVTGENPSHFKGKHRPVERVSWDDAQRFLQQLNKQVKLEDGLQFKLPSEAQWEYAARAQQNFEYSGSKKLNEVGWFSENSNGQTMPVGLKEPNAFGLYDMSGNIWEWCEDAWSDEVKRHPQNGTTFKEGDKVTRVIRGGSWYLGDSYARVLSRRRDHHYLRYYYYGFRVFRY